MPMLRPHLCLPLLAATLLTAGFHPAPVRADDSLAAVVADGEPWEMYVVKRGVSNILVFKPDGGGTISDSLVSINPTWRAIAGGICIKPNPRDGEKCLALARSKEGIVASQNGKAVFILKR